MTLAELKTFIKSETWWSEEAPGVPQTTIFFWRAHMEQSKYLPLNLPRVGYFLYKDDFMFEETLASDKLKIFHYLFDTYQKDSSSVKGLYTLWQEKVNHAMALGDQFVNDAPALSNADLWKRYERLSEAIIDPWRIGWLWESVDVFSDQEFFLMVRARLPEMSEEERQACVRAMTAPARLSYMEQARIDFLDCLLRGEAAAYAFAEHAKRYSWIGNNYKESRPLRADYFFSEAQRELGQKSRRELEDERTRLSKKSETLKREQDIYRAALPNDLRDLFCFLSDTAAFIDERKCFAQKAMDHIECMMRECSRRFEIEEYEVKYLLGDEMKEWCRRGKRTDRFVLQRRRHEGCALIMWRDASGAVHEQWEGAEPAKQLYDLTIAMQTTDTIKGQVACAPTPEANGTVQVVLDIGKTQFQDGNILVTTMTRPEFLPIMRRAKAVITDEGGIGCHAAVISRELRIPCIIGTKNATKLLKTEDTVTMNLTTGEVGKI